jgi:hypothetical protein
LSRIFEALNEAQVFREEKASPRSHTENLIEFPDRRRSRRLAIDVPVYVYGYGPGNDPFHEETHTLYVSSTGALLLLSAPVEPGDKLLLTNAITQREQVCVVIYVGKRHQRTTEVGITIVESSTGFW